jgi:hypothetical protein
LLIIPPGSFEVIEEGVKRAMVPSEEEKRIPLYSVGPLE